MTNISNWKRTPPPPPPYHSSYKSQLSQPAVVYFFQDGVLFSSENVKGTAFSKVYSENINTNPHNENTRYTIQVLNAPSDITNTPSQSRRHQEPKQQVRQPKRQVRSILIYAVLSGCSFCRKFTHFSGVQFTGKKMRWHRKNDKYEVCTPPPHFG